MSNLVEAVYGDTDSTYFCYSELLNTIDGIEKMTDKQKTEIIVKLHTEFLDRHNEQFMKDYYKTRFCNSVHNFELETVGTGVWLDVKKRYAQEIYYKDGKYYDTPKLKIKGLEMVKSSYPKMARNGLKELTKILLENDGSDLIHILNIKMQEIRGRWNKADIESICPVSSANNYNKYIVDDENIKGLQVNLKCPAVVRGLGYFNWIINTKKLTNTEHVYGGKVRYYTVKRQSAKQSNDLIFCYQPGSYPKWAEQYAPIDRTAMFKKCVLDPFNRMIEPAGLPLLSYDGSIQITLF